MSRISAFLLTLSGISCVAVIVAFATRANAEDDPTFFAMKCRDDQRIELAIEPTKLQGHVGHLRFQDELSRTRTVNINRRDNQMILEWGAHQPATFVGRSVPVSITHFSQKTFFRRSEVVFNTGDICFGMT
jgi:hypothetical protein